LVEKYVTDKRKQIQTYRVLCTLDKEAHVRPYVILGTIKIKLSNEAFNSTSQPQLATGQMNIGATNAKD